MKKTAFYVLALTLAAGMHSCKIVKQGDVGVKRTLGKIKQEVLPEGPRLFNPFLSSIITVPVRTINMEVRLDLPSKEGVNVEAEISILYHVEKSKAPEIVGSIGQSYEKTMILPVFRAASADVTAKFMAKDMHTGNRQGIESEIRQKMMDILEKRGFMIEAVLLKSIKLPPNLYRAIEEKLEAEQQAQRMEFVLQHERQEAERKRLEAEGIRNANKIISEGLTNEIIRYQALEVYRLLSNSPNTKVIIGGGTNPLMVDTK